METFLAPTVLWQNCTVVLGILGREGRRDWINPHLNLLYDSQLETQSVQIMFWALPSYMNWLQAKMPNTHVSVAYRLNWPRNLGCICHFCAFQDFTSFPDSIVFSLLSRTTRGGTADKNMCSVHPMQVHHMPLTYVHKAARSMNLAAPVQGLTCLSHCLSHHSTLWSRSYPSLEFA